MNRQLVSLLFVLLCTVAATAQQTILGPSSSGSNDTAQFTGTTAAINIPLGAPGVVTLSDAGAGSLAAGRYKIGVVAVNAAGGEGPFDPLGYAANNSIVIGTSHNILVSWGAVPGAAKYHVYVWGPTGTYYQRYYETASTSLSLSTNPVGPVAAPINVTASNTGGSLKSGNYYFAISAEFADGGTVDQTNYTEFPVATISTDTGS